VLELKENAVTVKFENIVTDVKKEFLSVYSCVNDRVVASRLQIPLVLSFGITIHKSQGLTLDRVEVHCEGIFKAGMLGVAFGRARKKKGLRVVNF
jgi:ATP-dependent exoDNAse (exonuclease V) alpha subunit